MFCLVVLMVVMPMFFITGIWFFFHAGRVFNKIDKRLNDVKKSKKDDGEK